MPFISRGGADLISTFLFRAYQGALGKENVVMLVTDKPSVEVPGWLDDGSQVICLDDECSFSDDEEKLVALHTCIGRIAPEKIVNVNSHLTWRLFERHGVQLSTVSDLYAFLFCFDYDKQRKRVGYITDYLPSTVGCLKAAFFDNAHIVDEIRNIYGFSSQQMQKLHTVYVPAADGLKRTDYSSFKGRDKILWVGRLSLQKRPDILVEIANALPGQIFDVYGSPGNSSCSEMIVNGKIPNINYRGVYSSLHELDLSEYACYLNTSEWDGLPTIIIQMMALGLPIVSSDVCGITELLNDNNGWLVSDFEDASLYLTELRKVLIQKNVALEKTNAAYTDVMELHQWKNFYKRLESLNAFADYAAEPRISASFKDRRKSA